MSDPCNDNSGGAKDNIIKVIARFRPLNDTEEKAESKFVASFPKAEGQEDPLVNIGGKVYQFDNVLKPDASQEKVYEVSAKNILKDVLDGYNGTIFSYGQTSSGKTHTMEGVAADPYLWGIIPRIINDIFNHIYSMEDHLEIQIKVSYFEIYMDKINDLLDVSKSKKIYIQSDKKGIPFLNGIFEKKILCPKDFHEAFQMGKANRKVSETKMNNLSSRSHSIFLIKVKQLNLETQKNLLGKLFLVDLAGSEKISKSGAEGISLTEAIKINKSLLTFGNVISALADGNKRSHIPYRDSILTRILQESLGGNSQTTIIICCSPASYNESETKSTLDFGKRAKTIRNVVTVNEEVTAEEWKRRYEKEKEKVARLKAIIEKIENTNGPISLDDDIDVDTSSMNLSVQSIPLLGLDLAAPVNVDALDWAKERETFPQQLDEKKNEINQQSQLIEKLKKQILEQKELDAIRNESTSRQIFCDRLKEDNQVLLVAQEQTKKDYEKLKAELIEATMKLNEQIAVNDHKEQSRQDFKRLEETVSKESRSLHNYLFYLFILINILFLISSLAERWHCDRE